MLSYIPPGTRLGICYFHPCLLNAAWRLQSGGFAQIVAGGPEHRPGDRAARGAQTPTPAFRTSSGPPDPAWGCRLCPWPRRTEPADRGAGRRRADSPLPINPPTDPHAYALIRRSVFGVLWRNGNMVPNSSPNCRAEPSLAAAAAAAPRPRWVRASVFWPRSTVARWAPAALSQGGSSLGSSRCTCIGRSR